MDEKIRAYCRTYRQGGKEGYSKKRILEQPELIEQPGLMFSFYIWSLRNTDHL